MTYRTTILLDEESRRAAKELALQLDCSMSEAIRTAIVRFRDASRGLPPASRAKRERALLRLFELFEGHDAQAEIARLKSEDQYF